MERRGFRLKRLCPVCEQGSALLFLTCPKCNTVVIACDEEGTLFPNPKDLAIQASYPCDPWVSTITKCPACDTINEFGYSAADEIERLGFKPTDYA